MNGQLKNVRRQKEDITVDNHLTTPVNHASNKVLILNDTLGYILSFLDWKNLLNAELVSKTWHTAVQRNHLWKKLFNQQAQINSSLALLYHRKKHLLTSTCLYDESNFFKKLFLNFQQLEDNWKNGRYTHKEVCLEETSISFVVMDLERIMIVLRKKHPNPFRIKIYNRWNLEVKHILNADDDLITDIKIMKNTMFSAHFGGKIIMWDLDSQQPVQIYQDFEAIEYMPICLAGNLLISGSIVASEVDPNSRDSFVTLRRIGKFCGSKPSPPEKVIEIFNSRVTNIISYDGFFAIFVCSMSFEIQIRIFVTKSLEFVKVVDLSFEGKISYALHNGLLATSSRSGNIEIFCLETLNRVWKIKSKKEVRQTEMNSNRVFVTDGDSEIIYWDLSNSNKEHILKPVSILAGRGKSFDSFVFDDVQIVALTNQFVQNGSRKVHLAVWDFDRTPYVDTVSQ